MELPKRFCLRMQELLGSEYPALEEAILREDAVKGLRLSRNAGAIPGFLPLSPFPMVRIEGTRDGFFLPPESGAGKHPFHHGGAYYLQDPGAMATVAAVPEGILERDGLLVLDLCAAPGGKTTQLLDALGRGGFVFANEYSSYRAQILRGNLERLGYRNTAVTNLDTKYYAEWYPEAFDFVLVDAPCSGEGMFRKNPLAVSEWSEGNVKESAERQREILENAARTVKAGGYLLYSTCTFSLEENEMQIDRFLAAHPAFSLLPVSEAIQERTAPGISFTGCRTPNMEAARRFYPHISKGEGQFLALMRKESGEAFRGHGTADFRKSLSGSDKRVVWDFLTEMLSENVRTLSGEMLALSGGEAVLFPDAGRIPLPKFGLVNFGVTVGEIRKGRLVPHHHFYKAYGRNCSARILLSPDDGRAERYLYGEEIEIDAGLSGYLPICYGNEDYSVVLGGGKAVGGRLKNHYPKGLRKKG